MIKSDEFAWYDPSYNSSILNLGKSAFKNSGENTVVISASGYEKLTLKIDGSTGSVITDGSTTDPVVPPETETKDAPTAANVTKDNYFGTYYYRVTFAGMDNNTLKAYLPSIKSVIVGTSNYNYASSLLNETNAYKWSATDTGYGMDNYDCLDLTTDGFSTTENTVVTVKAEGYVDLTFTVNKNGQLVTGDNSNSGSDGEDSGKLTPPRFSSAEKVTPILGGNYTRISFAGDNIVNYLKLVEGGTVTVNGNTITYAGSFWNSTQKFKFGNDPTYGGEYIYLDITEDSFDASGNSTVVISVDGYNDLTFTIDAKGNPVTE